MAFWGLELNCHPFSLLASSWQGVPFCKAQSQPFCRAKKRLTSLPCCKAKNLGHYQLLGQLFVVMLHPMLHPMLLAAPHATWHSPFLLAALLHVYVCNASPLARLCKPFCRAYVQALLQGLALLQGFFTAPCHFTVHSACICRLGSNSTSHHSGNSSPSMTCHIHSSGWSTCPLPLASFSRSNPYHIAHIGCSTSKGPLPFSCGGGVHNPCHPAGPLPQHSWWVWTYLPWQSPFSGPKEPFFSAQRTLLQGPKNPQSFRPGWANKRLQEQPSSQDPSQNTPVWGKHRLECTCAQATHCRSF